MLRYKVRGRSRKFGLGPTHTVGLALARSKAADARRLLLDGKDPIEQKRAVKAAALLESAKTITFDECSHRYIETNKAGWRNAKHASEWGKSLQRFASPVFGHLAVADVDTGLVVQALQNIWTTKPATASRVRGRIETVLNYAKAQGFRSGENAAALKGNLDHILPKHTATIKAVQHHPAMPHIEVPVLMTALRQRDEISAHALAFTILTAARRGEIISARWDEIDLDAKLWIVPGARMKSGREHRVPLSDSAIELLQKMQEVGRQHDAPEYVFPSSVKRGKPMAETGLPLMLHRLGHDDISLHGFRSSFRDFASELTNAPREVCEAALAHVVGDQVEAAYRRSDLLDRRRSLMEKGDIPDFASGDVSKVIRCAWGSRRLGELPQLATGRCAQGDPDAAWREVARHGDEAYRQSAWQTAYRMGR